MLRNLLSSVSKAHLLVVQQQRRPNTVNFFQRRTDNVLWNTVTSITKYGARKGRQRTRQRDRHLPMFYHFARNNPMRIRYPGLNERVSQMTAEKEAQIYIEKQSEEEREQGVNYVKLRLKGSVTRRPRGFGKERLSPWERGFSGGTYLGQRLGHPPPNEREGLSYEDFDCICFQIRRLTTMRSDSGRLNTIRTLVFIGNGKGVGGYALMRMPMFKTNLAIANAIRQASRRIFHVELFEDRTIYQDFFGEYRNTRVFAQRREYGYGVMAHPRIKKICELLGIKDIYVKVDGSTDNYVAICHAFCTGLVNQESHHRTAQRTRLHVVELSPNRQFFPRIVASPLNTPVKTDEELEPLERSRLDHFYGEGRFPLYRGLVVPHWVSSVGHKHAEWKKHPFRNMENRIIRLLADGAVPRWTRRERKKWSDMQQHLVETGHKTVPMGIGLSDWLPMEGEKEVFLGRPNDFNLVEEEEVEDEENGERRDRVLEEQMD